MFIKLEGINTEGKNSITAFCKEKVTRISLDDKKVVVLFDNNSNTEYTAMSGKEAERIFCEILNKLNEVE